MVYETSRTGDNPRFVTSAPTFMDWQQQSRAFSSMAAFLEAGYNLAGSDAPERVGGARVTGDFFRTLGVAPALGRALTGDDDRSDAARSAVLSWRLWQNRFAGDPGVIGRTVTLDERPYTVIGVMPADFRFPSADVAVWVPAQWSPQQLQSPAARGGHGWNVVARLHAGVTLAQARTEMETIADRLSAEYPDFQAKFGAAVYSLPDEAVGEVRTGLLVLMGAVGLVLLIACANVANLMLARAATRQREMAIRSAIGASRRALVRQLLTESLVLALGGGTLGLLLATWGTGLLASLEWAGVPADALVVDWRIATFAAGTSLLTGVLFGLAPALQAAMPDLNDVLKDGNKGSAGLGRGRMRDSLLVAEVALSLMLLVGAGLLVRSFVRLQATDPGFTTAHALTARVQLPGVTYADTLRRAAFHRELLERLGALPGVRSAALASGLPFSGVDAAYGFWADGQSYAASDVPVATFYAVSPAYFASLEVPLRRGRLFTDDDRMNGHRVALVNERLARQYFPGEDPVGRVVRVANPDDTGFEIVGIVADTRHGSLTTVAPPQLYVPLAQRPGLGISIVLRTTGDPDALASAVQREVRALNGTLPVSQVRSFQALVDEAMARPRVTALLLGVFAALALALAVVGIYGVIAYGVAQRTHEFGIRMALGAARGDVVRQVLRQAMGLAGIGIAVGLVAAAGLSRLLESLLFQVSATDPLTYLGLAALVAGVALVAAYIPARRATRVMPMLALRGD
jgi:putative ABC transport system permease protein